MISIFILVQGSGAFPEIIVGKIKESERAIKIVQNSRLRKSYNWTPTADTDTVQFSLVRNFEIKKKLLLGS